MPFDKILIANRGEIACRVANTATRMGIRTVAVYSDADAAARHVQRCDEAIRLGAAAPGDSYLRSDRLIAAALATGATAVHPGYGFLSEDPAFAQACSDAGLIFVGPPATAMAAMGSKAAAKTLMQAAGVPVVPGYHGEDQRPDQLLQRAVEIGFPVLIKAVAGGGGRGMRRVERSDDFLAALSACQREAQSSFGNRRVLLERCLLRPRHIEIQVLADQQGHCLHLFERDCSVQRRHQKVLEECPAPGLSAVQRGAMGATAVAAARAVGYIGAGTVEFITGTRADGELEFHFMEMNTRLQVEHPVTEAVTGLDLVEWQLRVAAGEALPFDQSRLVMRGHAIEARVCAENPERDFLPASGPITLLSWPRHVAFQRNQSGDGGAEPAALRIDAGFGSGDRIVADYDSMIAKVIAWGENRPQALARLDMALRNTRIAGIANNLAFLQKLAASPSFRNGELDTELIPREQARLSGQPGPALCLAVAAALARLLHTRQQSRDHDPWSDGSAWRLHGAVRRHFLIEAGGQRLPVQLEWQRAGQLRLHAPAFTQHPQGLTLEFHVCRGQGLRIVLDGRERTVSVEPCGEGVAVFAEEGMIQVRIVDGSAETPVAPAPGTLRAPMPGRVQAVHVTLGQGVESGQALVVLEAMKMEHAVSSPRAGRVSRILCAPGDLVIEGAELIQLADE